MPIRIRMVAAFGVALVLSPILPLFSGTALVIPIIVVMVAAWITGMVFFVRFLQMRRSRGRDRPAGPTSD